jgi:hypothetical protein
MSIEDISPKELYDIVSGTPEWHHLSDKNALDRVTINQFGTYLDGGKDPSLRYMTKPVKLGELWKRVKDEFDTLLCTNDRRYASFRRKLKAYSKHGETAIVSTIAAAVAKDVGVEAGVLTQFCALLLLAVLKVGKEAYCEGGGLDVKLIDIQPDDTDRES